MDIVTIDFETYYGDEYTLSKMTTEAYVRDPRFEVIGVGIKVNNYPCDWFSGTHAQIKKFLHGLDYSHRAILCHHAAFDGAILSWHFGVKPKFWLDTLSMARPLHNVTVGGSLAKLVAYYGINAKGDEVLATKGKRRGDFTPEELDRFGKYCINDANITKQLFDKLKRGFPVTELMVIDQTLRMYIEPRIVLDVPLLEQHLVEVRLRKEQLLAASGLTTETIMSNIRFAAVLGELGVDPPTKISPRTGQVAYAFSKTDKGLTDLLDHPDEQVQTVVAARLGVKSTIEETRTENLLGVAQRGALPVMLNYYGAHTGRFSGGDKLNLQNLPSRGNNTIRRALKAPPGHVVLACDSSQIEARGVAYTAGQEDLVEAFRQKRDVYSEFASEVYDRTITKGDKVERFVGKTCILGLGYGMGAEKLRRTLEIGQGGISVKIDIHEAQRIVAVYRRKNWKITELWQKCGNMLGAMVRGHSGELTPWLPYGPDGMVLPSGFKLGYPLLRMEGSGFVYVADQRSFRNAMTNKVVPETDAKVEWTKIYGGKVTENLIQALAAVVIREQMVRIGQRYPLVCQVHDEIVVVVPEAQAEEAQRFVEAEMSTAPKWAPGLPVACESGFASNYGDT